MKNKYHFKGKLYNYKSHPFYVVKIISGKKKQWIDICPTCKEISIKSDWKISRYNKYNNKKKMTVYMNEPVD